MDVALARSPDVAQGSKYLLGAVAQGRRPRVDHLARGGYGARDVLRLPPLLLLLLAAAPALGQDAHRVEAVSAEELAAAREGALQIEEALVSSLTKVRKSTVAVAVKRSPRDKDGNVTGEPRLAGCGSGVIIREKSRYYVITNQHVVEGSDALGVVSLGGVEHEVEVQDAVPAQDIALLRFKTKPKGLVPAIVSGRSSEKMEAGQWVLATGTPFFLGLDGQPVATLGVVSGKDRVLGGRFTYSAIQHDAEVNPGNSGGPLWNLDGELIGINGMIRTRTSSRTGVSNSGASFSIPIRQVERFVPSMVNENEDAGAGFLGLTCGTYTAPDGTPQGARINRIHKDSPTRGARKGLFDGCIVRSIAAGGKVHKVRTADDLTNALVLYPSGTEVLLKYRWASKERLYTWRGKLGSVPTK